MERRRDIQGLRAVAVLAVVAYHSGLPLAGGFLGVDVFFVISGFVIAGVLVTSEASGERHVLRRFYRRRFVRLTPALALVVVASIGIGLLLPAPLAVQSQTGATGFGALLLCANVVIALTTGGYFDQAADTNPLLHTWSLSVEEQFYLVVPALLLWLGRRSGPFRRRYQVLGLAVLGIASLVFTVWGASTSWAAVPAPVGGFYSPLVRGWEFIAGMLVFFASQRLPRPPAAIAAVFGFLGFAVLVVCLVAMSSTLSLPGPLTLVPVAATAALLWTGVSVASPMRFLLSRRLLVYLGDVSYSWYLWHWPLIVFARMLWPAEPFANVVAGFGALVPAIASFHLLENRLRRRWHPRRSRFFAVAAAIMIVPLLLSGVTYSSSRSEIGRQQSALGVLSLSSDMKGCFVVSPFTAASALPFSQCVLGDPTGSQPIYLIGDSNADMLKFGLDAAGKQLGRPLMVRTASSCPAVLVEQVKPNYVDDCLGLLTRTLNDLASSPRGTVVIGSSDHYWREPDIGIRTTTGLVTTTPDKAVEVQKGLIALIAAIQRLGDRVVVMMPIPNFVRWDLPAMTEEQRRCDVPVAIKASCKPYSESLADVATRQSVVWDSVRAATQSTGAQLVSIEDVLCPNGVCSYGSDGAWVYKDWSHISDATSLSLQSRWVSALSSR